MSHPFGDLIRQYLSRKHGLSQNQLAIDIHCDRALVSRMCKGERLFTPSARVHILNMIGWFVDKGALWEVDEADALLNAANAVGLRKENPAELLIINRINSLKNRQEFISVKATAALQPQLKSPINNLPYPFYGHFVGREKEFNQIIQYLRPGGETERYIYPVSIDGIGGIGKSSLALAIGYHFCNSYYDQNFHAVIWISAKDAWFMPAGLIPKSTQVYKSLPEILRSISKVLSFSEELESLNYEDWVELVYKQLRMKPTLLIIDNLETIDDDSVISFMQELPPPTKLILTTRRKIDIAKSIRLGEMTREDTLSLIETLVVGNFLSKEQKEKLYEHSGGVPLVLIWAVSQINLGMSIDILLQKLKSSAHIKDIAKYCFDQSIEIIKSYPYCFDMLCALSVFETGATRITIGRISGVSVDEITRDDGLILLEKLALITRNDNLFTLLPLTRSYVISLLDVDHILKKKILDSLVDWIVEIIQVDTEKDQNIIQYLEAEHQLLLMAAQHCNETEEFYLAKKIVGFSSKFFSTSQIMEWEYLREELEKNQSRTTKLTKVDLDVAVRVDYFFGRMYELEMIKNWIVGERCNLVGIIGFGGMGKSSLAAKAIEVLFDEFDYIIWRSLANGLKPGDLYQEILQVLLDSVKDDIPKETNAKLELLLNYFSRFRCLIVVDNFETVLTKGNPDEFLAGYSEYENLISELGKRNLKSCVILTSREEPSTIRRLELNNSKVRKLILGGLLKADVQSLFSNLGVQSSDELLNTLIHKYSGNPLAIKWAVNLLQGESTGNVLEIISSRLLPRDLNNLVAEQLMRLSKPEKEVLTWAAIEHAPVDINGLSKDVLFPANRHNLQKIAEQLMRRSFIEFRDDILVMSPFLSEFILDSLVQEVTDELLLEKIDQFINYPLMKAQTTDHIRNAQKILIVDRIVQELITALGSEQAAINKLNKILGTIRKLPREQHGYAVGNIINLLAYMDHKLNHYDFSKMQINQALLQFTNLHNVNFSESDFRDTVFAEIFDIVLTVIYDPKADITATGTVNGTIVLWDGLVSRQLDILNGHNGWVRSVCFHPTNKHILASGAADSTVRIWDIESGASRVLHGHADWVRSVAFSPDEVHLASAGSDARVIIWDIKTSAIVKILEGHTDWIWSLCYTNTGNSIMSVSNDGTVRIWDLFSDSVRILRHSQGRIITLAYLPSSEIVATGGTDNVIYIWDAKTGVLLRTLIGHNNHIWCLKFSSDGNFLFSGGMDKNIIVWDFRSGNINKILNGHTGYITSIDCDTFGNILISGSYDQSIRLWDIRTGQCVRRLEGKSNSVNTVSVRQMDQLIASAGDDKLIHIWDYKSGTHHATLSGHASRVKSVAFSHNGLLLASASDDQTVKLWDVNEYSLKYDLIGHSAWVYSVAFNPDDTVLASGSDDFSIRLWDLRTGKCLRVLQQDNFIYSIAFSPSGHLFASGGADKLIWLWDTVTGELRNKLEGHSLRVNAVAYCREDLIVSGGDDGLLVFWSPISARIIKQLSGHNGPIRAIDYSYESEIIASCSDDKTVRVWNLHGECIAVIVNEFNVRSCVVLQGGKTLALSDTVGLIKIWDIPTQTFVAQLRTNRIYENMNIGMTTGLTKVQKSNLKALGAID